MMITQHDRDGSNTTLPRWTNWSESWVTDGKAKLKAAYASRLPLLKSLSADWDPNGMFVSKFFPKMFAPTEYGTVSLGRLRPQI